MHNKSSQFSIESLELTDFRCFHSYFVDFNLEPRTILDSGKMPTTVGPLTVLVAKNGMGKTSILDAIRILFGTYTNSFSPHSKSAGQIKSFVHAFPTDIRIFRENDGYLSQAMGLAIHGKVFLGGELVSVNRELSPKEGARTTTKGISSVTRFAHELVEKRKMDASVSWPLIAFYGTGRLWSPTKTTERTLLAMDSPAFGYENCLGKNHNFKAVNNWLTKAISKRNIDIIDDLKPNPMIEAQIRAISSCLGCVFAPEEYLPELTIESLTDELAIKQVTSSGTVPVAISQLSDGVRAVFGLVADIAFRCAKLNPHFGAFAPQQTEGIILIDEVDLHLHPAWQQRILGTLQMAFPNLQFIVTTHSPQVVSSVPMECVRIIDLDEDESDSSSSQTQGVESQDILANVFDTNPAPENDEWVIKLSEYASKVALGHAGDKDPLYQELVEHYGTDYQPLLRIELQRRFLNRKEASHA